MRRFAFAAGAVLLSSACTPPAPVEAPPVEAPAPVAAPTVPAARFTPGAAPRDFTLTLGDGQTLALVQVGPIGGAMARASADAAPEGLAAVLQAETDGAAIIGYDVASEAGWTAPDKLCGAKPATSIAILYRDGRPDALAAFTGDKLGGPAALLCTMRDVEADAPEIVEPQ